MSESARFGLRAISGRRPGFVAGAVIMAMLGLGSVAAALPAGAAGDGRGGSGPGPDAAPAASAHTPAAVPGQAGPSPNNIFSSDLGGYTSRGFALSANGNVGPNYVVGGAPTSLNVPERSTFDAAGNLWVPNLSSNSVVEFAKAQLASSGNPTPAVTLTNSGTSLDEPSAVAFDSSGNLWVADVLNNTLVEFTPSQLVTGSPTPVVIISTTAGSLNAPNALLFTSTGNLWVANAAGPSVVQFPKASLAATGSPAPSVTILSDGAGDLSAPGALAFDSSGNLWVASVGGNKVLAYTSAQQVAGGPLTPNTILSGLTFRQPEALAFDGSGNLWVPNFANSTVVQVASGQLGAGARMPPAAVTLSATSATPPSLSGPTDALFDSSGNLWVANQGLGVAISTLSAFAPSQLGASGMPAPSVQITPIAGLEGPIGAGFDASGNLWLADDLAGTLVGFSPAQIAAGANRPGLAVALPVNASGGSALSGLAVDSTGNVWVSDALLNVVYEMTPAQLGAGGAPTPAVTLSATGTSLDQATSLAFDSSGNLWATNEANNTVVEFAKASLAATGSPAPAVVLSASGGSLNHPEGLTFDPTGNLWVTNTAANTLVKFAKASLASSGAPAPAVTISATAGSLAAPFGVTFDLNGNIWVSNQTNNSLVSFTPAQLASTGSPVPTTTVKGAATGMNTPTGLATPQTSQRPTASGYWEVASDGGIFSFGQHQFYGSMGGQRLNQPVVGMAATPVFGPKGGKGYWMVASDGGIFSFGDAQYFGSMGGQRLNQPVVGMAPTADGKGYWMVASDGGIFSFGDAQFFGSMGGQRLNKPVVGMAPTADGKGYWMVASDGGIFSFGDAQFMGSMGGRPLNKPVVGMAATPTGNGYWMTASDGGIFSFGDGQYFGSMGGRPLNNPVNGIATTNDGLGYWMVASDGGIFSFGDATFAGSMGGMPLNKPVVGMAN